MEKEEALELYNWIKKLEGKIVKFPSGLKKKSLTDHLLVSIKTPSFIAEEKNVKNFRIAVKLIHITSKKNINTSADEVKRHNS